MRDLSDRVAAAKLAADSHKRGAFSVARGGAPDLGMLVVRLFAGLSLSLAHGVNHFPPPEKFSGIVAAMGFPAPTFFAWAAGTSEFVGGILLALGLATRVASALILCTMFTAGIINGIGDPYHNRELPLLFGAVALMFLLSGAGRYSLDELIAARWADSRNRQDSIRR
jgi:putative oxidoreductase